jgi:hypothetical protein
MNGRAGAKNTRSTAAALRNLIHVPVPGAPRVVVQLSGRACCSQAFSTYSVGVGEVVGAGWRGAAGPLALGVDGGRRRWGGPGPR